MESAIVSATKNFMLGTPKVEDKGPDSINQVRPIAIESNYPKRRVPLRFQKLAPFH
jgi:hypothetical protein